MFHWYHINLLVWPCICLCVCVCSYRIYSADVVKACASNSPNYSTETWNSSKNWIVIYSRKCLTSYTLTLLLTVYRKKGGGKQSGYIFPSTKTTLLTQTEEINARSFPLWYLAIARAKTARPFLWHLYGKLMYEPCTVFHSVL